MFMLLPPESHFVPASSKLLSTVCYVAVENICCLVVEI